MKKENDNKKVNTQKKTGEKDSKKTVEVVFILDRSGSMSGLERDTIGGFNSMLKRQKDEGNDIIWTTVLFDHEISTVHDRLPLDKVRPLDERTYYVRGTTALLDATGETIKRIGIAHKYARPEDRPDRTLVVITTDGLENASTRYDASEVRRMIGKEKEKYGWEFIFLGADIEAEAVAGSMGIDRSRAARYHNDSEGIGLNYQAVSEITVGLAKEGIVCETCLESVRADYKSRSKKR